MDVKCRIAIVFISLSFQYYNIMHYIEKQNNSISSKDFTWVKYNPCRRERRTLLSRLFLFTAELRFRFSCYKMQHMKRRKCYSYQMQILCCSLFSSTIIIIQCLLIWQQLYLEYNRQSVWSVPTTITNSAEQ